jgi:DNA-binding NtrC family response regulator
MNYKPDTKELKVLMREYEKVVIEDALMRHRWHQGKAAVQLGVSQVCLHFKMKKYKLLKSQGGE